MRYALIGSCLGLVASASCATIAKRQDNTGASTNVDPTVLSFALILEHLEDTFYRQGLANFSADAFTSAGIPSAVRDNIAQIAADEASHVAVLTSALSAAGASPPQACTYNFGVNSVQGFLGLAQVLEGVGVSAYSGAAPLITSKAYLEVAANILTVEARHNAFIRLVNGRSPFPAPYDIGISPSAVVTLAGSFFASCPSGSAPTFKAFPALTASNAASVQAGGQLQLTATNVSSTSGLSCAFASGGVTAFTSYSNGACSVPSNITNGQNYVYLTNGTSAITDATTVAGPAILELGAANNSVVMGAGSNATSTSSSQAATTSKAGSASSLFAPAGAALTLVLGFATLLV